ncbi:MAG: glycosyltransferase [Alphaproteobacteria bacterium]|nr:glycosyltransferase [Alphaproteobacteria bacterium]
MSSPPVTNAPDNDPIARANELWKQGRVDDAESAYRDAIKKKPKAAWAFYRLGEIYENRGDETSAEGFFGQALALDPALAVVRDKAIFWKRFKFADSLLEARNLAASEPIFGDLLAINPKCAPVLVKLGSIAAEYGHLETALGYYERAIESDPEDPGGYVGKAEVLDALDETDGAIVVLEYVQALPKAPSVVKDRLERLYRKQRLLGEGAEGVRIRHWPANVPAAAFKEKGNPHVAVISWSLAHNPVGRAMVLADVASAAGFSAEIMGPILPSYGEDIWPPLRDGARDVDVFGFFAASFANFVEGAIRLVMQRPAQVAWVSKPQFPSLLIGFLYKLIHGSAVVLDIDDDELAFARADAPLSMAEFLRELASADWREPHSKRWTQLAHTLIPHADAISVCNPVLKEKFGGTIVRHARGEAQFALARARREEFRREFGFSHHDKVVLFLGTPRRHKGVLDVAAALRAIGDPQAVFCIIGTVPDRELRKQLETFSGVRIALHPDQPFSRLAELNAMADVVCVLQDPLDRIAQSQTPAKLTDAIATGTTILATPVPPILDMMDGGRIISVSDGNLAAALANALSTRNSADADERREYFRRTLSTDANAPAARAAIDAACEKNAPLAAEVRQVFELFDRSMPGSLPQDCRVATKGLMRTGPRVGALKSLRSGINLVFFWKQNDSGIYGRRSDMLLQQFAAMPNIDRILHIDAPISVDALGALVTEGDKHGQSRLVVSNTINRFLEIRDDGRVKRRSFVYRGRESRLLGRELPSIEEFPNTVENWLEELGMMENVLAWVCPVVRGFPEVQKRLEFSFVVSDVIDDQRQWPMRPAWRLQLEKNYRETFAATKVSFANCAPVADWLVREGLEPLIVSNGMDVRTDADNWDMPEALKALRRPIIGYCGSLSHRIDWDIIAAVSAARPDWSIVLIGEPAKDERYSQVVRRPNVHALGVLPYETALRHIAGFDAAMIPHLHSPLSQHMNPLKLYVYRGLGVPVVSAAIANLDDLKNDIRIANSPEEFINKLDEAIAERRARGRIYPSAALIRVNAWQSRAASIWARLEEVLAREAP